MHISCITLFPEMFPGVFDTSIMRRAKRKNSVTLSCIQLRNFALGTYRMVDDRPYGGGNGMILRVDVAERALAAAKKTCPDMTPYTVLLDPQGVPYTQSHAVKLSHKEHLILFCGHYEGIDERIRMLVDEEISIGDYILTCGEIPAMVIADSVIRLLPGVLTKKGATFEESFSDNPNLLEYPQYTRPDIYKNKKVPAILLSGNHAKIQAWRTRERTKRTIKRRPDLLKI